MRNQILLFILALGLLLAPTGALAQRVVTQQATQYLQQRADLHDAMEYLRQNAETLGLTEADLADLVVTDRYVSKHNGVTHLYLQQYHQDIPVFGALINLNFDKNGRVLNVGNRFVQALQGASKNSAPSIAADMAVQTAARELDLTPDGPIMIEEERSPNDVTFSTGGIASEPIPAKLVYLPLELVMPMEHSDVRLAWQVGIYTEDGQHLWNSFVDAGSGQVLFREDLVLEDRFDVTDAPGEARFMDVTRQQIAQAPLLPLARNVVTAPARSASSMSGMYRVYAQPNESPSHAGDPETDLRTLEANPADPTASPLGWHDDGTTSYTITRGNNVHAYTDLDADNVADPGSDPDGGAGLLFDFPFDPLMNPDTYRPAAVTNLFYWNNIIHDITYQYGFDEASGNFQVNNFGNGGLGGDDVRAEAQDGSGTNNANFGTPNDGFRPRMQMFVWSAAVQLTVNAPASIAGNYPASPAAFGPSLTAAGTTGNVVLVNDGAGASTTDACEPLVGFPAGDIALLDRGSCTFVLKVKNAQDAGAIAAIVVNNVSGGTVTMGGTDPTIVIPSLMISLEDGDVIKSNLPVNVTLKSIGADRDSDFDNGVIVHEYGHGISNRLTGGPNTLCLGGQEQMGEGWSDYLALLLTDTDTDNRGIGTYVIFEPTTGLGIRPFPYSTSFGTNPATYATIADPSISVPHGVGFVWATMLWDMTRNLVDRYGYDADIYGGTGGNNLGLQLVMDGMKMQPCFPGFVDGRDAILAADQALTGGANQCTIWDSFAARGLGFSADQGSVGSRFDGTEAFDLPASCCTFALLAGKVNDLQTAGALNKGQANSLLKKLDNAEKNFDRGKANTATNVINAFVNEVNDLVANGVLTPEQGQDLLDCALGLISRIEQGTPNARFMADAGTQGLAELAAGELPKEFALGQNYPNPFNPTTQIEFALPEASHVRLMVYDMLGREVRRLVDGDLPAGVHQATFDGYGLASGMYFYSIEAGAFRQVRQMLLVK